MAKRKNVDPDAMVSDVLVNRERFKNGLERRMKRLFNQIRYVMCDEKSPENDEYENHLITAYDTLADFYCKSGFDLTRFENELKGWKRP